MEDEANKFAAQFLMPRQDIAPDLYDLSIEKFLLLKGKWMTSARSLVMTAQRLNKVTERTARYYFMKMNSLWGGNTEPAVIPPEIERPRILQQLVGAHLSRLGLSIDDLSEIFGLERAYLEDLYSLEERPKLRVITN
jgi:hypothetical protein